MSGCEQFERWLDDGMPSGEAATHAGHAAVCARCAAALAAARALDDVLARAVALAPDGMADRVMERVARTRQARLAAWLEPEVLPWWVRAAAEPATVMATVLAGLMFWQYQALARMAAAVGQMLAGPATNHLLRMLTVPAAPGLGMLANPYVVVGLVLAGLPLAWWAGLALYHWTGDEQPLRHGRH